MASILALLPALLLVLIGIRLLSNWRYLSKAPGPALAGASDLWRAYQQYNGRLKQRLVDLHAKHGPIVRYGVRNVSISDPEVINAVYGSRAGFVTADSYKVLVGIQNGKEVPSLVSTADEKKHGLLRRSVANAFTPTTVLEYEGAVDATIADLLGAVQRQQQQPPPHAFDLAAMMLWYNMDAASRFSFGETLGCLAAEGDVGGSLQLIRDRFSHWGRWASLPQLERLVYRNPLALRRATPARAPSKIVAAAVAKLQARKSAESAGAAAPDLLQKFLDASPDYPQALDAAGIVGLLMSTISGAGDTTATTMAAALYYLARHPAKLATLRAELEAAQQHRAAAFFSAEGIPAFAAVAKLPYLHAVLREALRVFPINAFPMERVVPAGGITVAGMYFPPGAVVGCLPAAVHRDVRVFGPDADAFRPERWLEADPEQLRRMEAAHMGFSRGRRSCLGQHIAMLQMKKVIPALVMKFEISLVDPDVTLEADFTPAVACLKPLYVKAQAR